MGKEYNLGEMRNGNGNGWCPCTSAVICGGASASTGWDGAECYVLRGGGRQRQV